jgi:hypothetical protein
MKIVTILIKIAHGFEFKKFKDAVKRNPNDHSLRARFAMFCLNYYFSHQTLARLDEREAVNQYENIDHSELRELEIYYLMGKYYLGSNDKKAAEVYLKGIKSYNEFAARDYAMRHEYVEMAFSIALNLLKLENNHAGPHLEQFFKIVRHTYLKNFLIEKVMIKRDIGWPPSRSVQQIEE